MNAKQKANWARLRAGGRRRFILRHGILEMGGIYAALSLVATYFSKYGLTGSKIGEYLWSAETIFKAVFGWLFYGLFMGLFFWQIGERKFKKLEKDKT